MCEALQLRHAKNLNVGKAILCVCEWRGAKPLSKQTFVILSCRGVGCSATYVHSQVRRLILGEETAAIYGDDVWPTCKGLQRQAIRLTLKDAWAAHCKAIVDQPEKH